MAKRGSVSTQRNPFGNDFDADQETEDVPRNRRTEEVVRTRRTEEVPRTRRSLKTKVPSVDTFTRRASTPSGLPAPKQSQPEVQKVNPKKIETRPQKTEVTQRRRGKTQDKAVSNSSLTSSAYSSNFSSTNPPSSPYGYTSLYTSSPSASTTSTASQPPKPKNKIIPALRAAGTRRAEEGHARSVDQGTALEILSKIVGKNVTISDIEKEKSATGMAIFAQPTELVTLFELAMRMVESHQFYAKTLP